MPQACAHAIPRPHAETAKHDFYVLHHATWSGIDDPSNGAKAHLVGTSVRAPDTVVGEGAGGVEVEHHDQLAPLDHDQLVTLILTTSPTTLHGQA